jgi:hypothetical protein
MSILSLLGKAVTLPLVLSNLHCISKSTQGRPMCSASVQRFVCDISPYLSYVHEDLKYTHRHELHIICPVHTIREMFG